MKTKNEKSAAEKPAKAGKLKKIAVGLYRNPSSGAHYAKFKANGNQVYENLQTTEEAVAKRKLRLLRVDYEDFKPAGAGSKSFLDRCNLYLETISHQAPSTIYNKKLLVQYVEQRFPSPTRDIKKILPSECEKFLSTFKGDSWHRHALGVLKDVFRQAQKDNIVIKSPVAELKPRKGHKIVRHTPSEEDFYRIVDSIRAQKHNDSAEESAAVIEFYGLAGVGKREAFELTWQKVHWDTNRLTHFRVKTRAAFQSSMTAKLRKFLIRRLAKARKINGKDGVRLTDKVFSIFNPTKALSEACKRLHLPHYSTRAIRRIFIKKAIKAGVNIKAIAASQGHQDGGILILKTYSSDFDNQLDEMGTRLNDFDKSPAPATSKTQAH